MGEIPIPESRFIFLYFTAMIAAYDVIDFVIIGYMLSICECGLFISGKKCLIYG